MELLLNLVWFLIAGVALWSFLGAPAGDRKQFLFALAALCCAILLLFPTISVSDDLHFQAFVSEDSSASKRLVDSASHLTPFGFFATFLIGCLLAGLRPLWIIRKTRSVSRFSPSVDRSLFGRAPPAFVMA